MLCSHSLAMPGFRGSHPGYRRAISFYNSPLAPATAGILSLQPLSGRLAQLVSALRSHRRGRRFESYIAHRKPQFRKEFAVFSFSGNVLEKALARPSCHAPLRSRPGRYRCHRSVVRRHRAPPLRRIRRRACSSVRGGSPLRRHLHARTIALASLNTPTARAAPAGDSGCRDAPATPA